MMNVLTSFLYFFLFILHEWTICAIEMDVNDVLYDSQHVTMLNSLSPVLAFF